MPFAFFPDSSVFQILSFPCFPFCSFVSSFFPRWGVQWSEEFSWVLSWPVLMLCPERRHSRWSCWFQNRSSKQALLNLAREGDSGFR